MSADIHSCMFSAFVLHSAARFMHFRTLNGRRRGPSVMLQLQSGFGLSIVLDVVQDFTS